MYGPYTENKWPLVVKKWPLVEVGLYLLCLLQMDQQVFSPFIRHVIRCR